MGSALSLGANEEARLLNLSAKNFDAVVQESELPIGVLFWPAKYSMDEAFETMLKDLAAELEGKAVIGRVDSKNNAELVKRYKISKKLP